MIKRTIHRAVAHSDVRFNTQLDEATGLTYNHLLQVISGDSKAIDLEMLDKLWKALDCSVGDLMEYTPDE